MTRDDLICSAIFISPLVAEFIPRYAVEFKIHLITYCISPSVYVMIFLYLEEVEVEFLEYGFILSGEWKKMAKKVLVIDDDPELGKLVEAILKPIDLSIYQAYSGPDGLKKAYDLHPDVIILDVMMPGMDGFEVCTRLRELANTPILMLTARVAEADALRGFRAGADDYVKKPFSKAELEARLRALLRRGVYPDGNDGSEITRYSDDLLTIDLEAQLVEMAGKPVELSSIEYNLLACLVRNAGNVVLHRQLLQEVWGSRYGNPISTLTLYIHYLRRKLEDSQHGHQYIHTQSGRGYWFLPRNKP